MVLKKYEADIKDEVKRKLIGDSYRKALDEKKIAVIGYPDIEEIQLAAARRCNSPPPSRPRRNFNCRNTRACPPNARRNQSPRRTWIAPSNCSPSSTRNLRPSRASCAGATWRW